MKTTRTKRVGCGGLGSHRFLLIGPALLAFGLAAPLLLGAATAGGALLPLPEAAELEAAGPSKPTSGHWPLPWST